MERNPDIPFTYEYSQPEAYHFSLDSIEMPWQVANHFKERMNEKELTPKELLSWNCLDLCAGSGVLGFELNFHMPELRQWSFVEVQKEYLAHFEHNKGLALARAKALPVRPQRPVLQVVGSGMSSEAHVSPGTIQEPDFQFLAMNYDDLLVGKFEKKFDLVVCNPPYFMPDQGQLSPSEFKNRCRFFLDSTFEKMVECFLWTLSDKGECYLLLRELEDHGKDIFMALRTLTRGRLEVTNLMMIRGTFLLKLTRLV